MSSTDISGKLGEYMLKGWVLTDIVCPDDGCVAVPLMRSPTNRAPTVYHCVNCNTDPISRHSTLRKSSPARDISPSTAHTSSTRLSRSSTPATDVSSALSSPTFAPAHDTEEALRRRQQSDAASAEIGRRLLKGWAMLADECQNDRCIGVPLVRPPKTGGGKDPRKECVACGTIYIDEKDAPGWDRLIPLDPPVSHSIQDSRLDINSNHGEVAAAINTNHTLQAQVSKLPDPQLLAKAEGPASLPSLNAARNALNLSLQSLSHRLTVMSGDTFTAEPALIGQTVDAMGKVLQVLEQTERLQKGNGPHP